MRSEHGNYPDNPIVDDQRLACKRNYPLLSNPLLVGYDGIFPDVIRGICCTFLCDSLDLKCQQGVPVDSRMGSSAGFELQYVGQIIEVPNASKNQVEVTDKAVDAKLQAFMQNPASRQCSPNFGSESLQIRPPRQRNFCASALADNRSQKQAREPEG